MTSTCGINYFNEVCNRRGPPGPQGPSYKLFGNIAYVDSVYGNDSYGQIGATTQNVVRPFASVKGAIDKLAALGSATADNPCAVVVNPGMYQITEQITVPSHVSIVGTDASSVILEATPDANFMGIVMQSFTRLESFTLRILPTAHFTNCFGVIMGDTASNKIRNLNITIDQSGLGAGTSNVYGVVDLDFTTPPEQWTDIRATTIEVLVAGDGIKRGVYCFTGGSINMRDCVVYVNDPITASSDVIGIETSNANSTVNALACFIGGSTNDIKQTLGVIRLSETRLANNTCGGINFSTTNIHSTIQWGTDSAGVGTGGPKYLRFGSGAVNTGIWQKMKIYKSCVVGNFYINAVAGNVNRTYVFEIMKDTTATPLAITITNGASSGENTTDAVTFLSGELISLRVTISGTGSSSISDIVASVTLY